MRLEQAKAAPLESLEFLDLLVQDELTRRADRLFARRLKQAGITQVKEFSSFDWAFNPKISQARLVDLVTARFIRDHHGALLIGPAASGIARRRGDRRAFMQHLATVDLLVRWCTDRHWRRA